MDNNRMKDLVEALKSRGFKLERYEIPETEIDKKRREEVRLFIKKLQEAYESTKRTSSGPFRNYKIA